VKLPTGKHRRIALGVGGVIGVYVLLLIIGYVGQALSGSSAAASRPSSPAKTHAAIKPGSIKEDVAAKTGTAKVTKPAAPAPKPRPARKKAPRRVRRQSAEPQMCDSRPVKEDRLACHFSYTYCSAMAEAAVRKYYNGHGPTLDTIAIRYAKETYGSDYLDWSPGYGGCFAALSDAYDRLYGH
jgi:hypothetical protein